MAIVSDTVFPRLLSFTLKIDPRASLVPWVLGALGALGDLGDLEVLGVLRVLRDTRTVKEEIPRGRETQKVEEQ